MDYKGTAGNDTIDQAALGLPGGTNIFGGGGNDTITVTDGNGIGEAGNDTIIGKGDFASVAYWNSPAGVTVNLAAGTAQDGFGTTDKLQGIRIIKDSIFNDHLTGSGADDQYWLSSGSDTVVGGGGNDTVTFYNVKSTEVTISYDKATDTFTLVKNTAAGDKGTSRLTGISRIDFTGPESDNTHITRDMYDDSDGFLRSRFHMDLVDGGKIAQMRAGDFNGDGKQDILIVRTHPDLGLTAEPLQILIGDGNGTFTDQTAAMFKDGVIPKVNYVPRIFAVDFNKDGISDIFNPDFGYDAPPFPGGQNSLYLSNPGTKLLENATASLPQALRQNHGTSVGDVNKDGFPDLLVNALNEYTGNANQLLINDGTGHFRVSQELLPASFRQPGWDPGYTWSALRDLNNDGYDDMVLGTQDGSRWQSYVLMNDGHGSFANATPIALPDSGVSQQIVLSIETIDLNGDALPDLVLSISNGGSDGPGVWYKHPYLQFLINDGGGRFHDETDLRMPQSKIVTSTSHNWYLSATPIDVNGDGFEDIVTNGNSAYSSSKVFMNDGTGRFTEGWQSGTFTNLLAVDVNGDGKPDLVESSFFGLSVVLNAFPNRVPESGVYRAGDAGERIVGGSAAETIHSGAGNDIIDAGAGRDTVAFSGNRSGYTVTKTDSGFTVTGLQGTDTLAGVERLAFGDRNVALDIDGIGGQAYRIYQAAFDRTPDTPGLGFWISMMDQGSSLLSVAQEFVQSNEFKTMYGANPTYNEIVSKLYENILNRPGEAAGIEFWVGALQGGHATVAEVLAGFSESNENKANLVGVTQNGVEYDPFG